MLLLVMFSAHITSEMRWQPGLGMTSALQSQLSFEDVRREGRKEMCWTM